MLYSKIKSDIYLLFFCIFIFFTAFKPCIAQVNDDQDTIAVDKRGENQYFIRNISPDWESKSFDVIDKVKDKQGIAIDLGAGIGTTAIWLAKNFHHVIAVEADRESLESLRNNLTASDCPNVSVCAYPVANIRQNMILSPKGNLLNESQSFIKEQSDGDLDFVVKSKTFKEILYDYVLSNTEISSHPIALIKCDIEGGEEMILEDVLHHAYYNNVPVYMSFHLDWWKSKKIDDFDYLFNFFSTNCGIENVSDYIKSNPFCSILFEPQKNAGTLFKTNMTAVIIGYNLVSYIKNTVKQLEKYTSDIIIVDNKSFFQPLLDYYENDYKYTLVKCPSNYGHEVYKESFIQKLVGDVYILTDPDLQFNPNLPDNFIAELIEISNYFGATRVGFALEIDSDNIRTEAMFGYWTIKDWERRFWLDRATYPQNLNLELYYAPMDTTFCLINKNLSGVQIRVAGSYTCQHLPWYNNFKEFFMPGEFESYQIGNVSTNWTK